MDVKAITDTNVQTSLGLFGLLILALGITGCGDKGANSLASKHARVFRYAEAQTKVLWDTAAAAVETNGYVAASLSLAKLHQTSLSPEQKLAVEEISKAITDQMYDAANAGESNALAAIEELRKRQFR